MARGFRITEEAPDRKYFTMVPNYIINHSTIWERDVYLIMKRIAGEDGSCYASHQTIAKMTGVSRPTISRTIPKLIKRGWIKETGKVAGKTHPTKNYVIANLWKENFDYYEDEKKRKLENQSSQNTKDTSTTEPKIRKPQIYKEEPILRRTNIVTKVTRKTSFGNPDINLVLEYLKEKMELPRLDLSEKVNRQYAHNLIRRSKTGAEGVKWLIDLASKDGWFKSHITSFRDLWNNQVKIMSSTRKEEGGKQRLTIIRPDPNWTTGQVAREISN